MTDLTVTEKRLHTIDFQSQQFTTRLARLEHDKQQLEQGVLLAKSSPLELVRKQKEIETHLVEHDSTGAKQVALLEEHMKDMIKDRGWEVNESDGHLISSESDTNNYYGMVALTELDRLNNEGGHKAGNSGLGSTVNAIEQAILSVIPEEAL